MPLLFMNGWLSTYFIGYSDWLHFIKAKNLAHLELEQTLNLPGSFHMTPALFRDSNSTI